MDEVSQIKKDKKTDFIMSFSIGLFIVLIISLIIMVSYNVLDIGSTIIIGAIGAFLFSVGILYSVS